MLLIPITNIIGIMMLINPSSLVALIRRLRWTCSNCPVSPENIIVLSSAHSLIVTAFLKFGERIPAKNISLSDALSGFIQQRANVDDFGTATEYARNLNRINKSKEAESYLKTLSSTM